MTQAAAKIVTDKSPSATSHRRSWFMLVTDGFIGLLIMAIGAGIAINAGIHLYDWISR